MKKSGGVNLEPKTNSELIDLSRHRQSRSNLIWRKKDIVAELITQAHKREIKE